MHTLNLGLVFVCNGGALCPALIQLTLLFLQPQTGLPTVPFPKANGLRTLSCSLAGFSQGFCYARIFSGLDLVTYLCS